MGHAAQRLPCCSPTPSPGLQRWPAASQQLHQHSRLLLPHTITGCRATAALEAAAQAQLPASASFSCLACRDLERLRQEWLDFCGSHSLGPGAAGGLKRQPSEASLRLRPQTGPALLQDSMHQGEGALTAAVPTCNSAATALSSGLACWQPLLLVQCMHCTPHSRRGHPHTSLLADGFCFFLMLNQCASWIPRPTAASCSAPWRQPGCTAWALQHTPADG